MIFAVFDVLQSLLVGETAFTMTSAW